MLCNVRKVGGEFGGEPMARRLEDRDAGEEGRKKVGITFADNNWHLFK